MWARKVVVNTLANKLDKARQYLGIAPQTQPFSSVFTVLTTGY